MTPKKILLFSVGPVFTALLSLVSLPIMAWNFNPVDVGRNNVFQIATSLSLLLFVFGLDQAYVREFHESKDRDALFKACLLPGLLSMTIGVVVVLPIGPAIARTLYGSHSWIWYCLTAVTVILSFVARFLSLILRMEERGLAYSLSQVFPKLLVVTALVLVSLLTEQPNYTYLLTINFLSMALIVLIFGWNTRDTWIPATRSQVSFADLRRLLRFGAPLIGAGLAYWGMSATSALALRATSGFEQLGVYSVASSIAGGAAILQSVFSTVWMPTVYKLVAQNKDLYRLEVVRRQLLSVVCLMLCLTGAFAWVLDMVLPPAYRDVKTILTCCMAQPLLYTLSETTVIGLNVQRKSTHAFGIAVVSFGANVLFNWVLTPPLGAAGAAISNCAAYAIFLIARTELSARVWIEIPRQAIYTSLGVLLILMILNALPLGIPTGTMAGIWFAAAALFTGFFWRELTAIVQFLRRGIHEAA